MIFMSDYKVIINIAEQTLRVFSGFRLIKICPASTATNGVGNRMHSYCTPLGKHIIRTKIGRDLPSGAVFWGRRWTGEIYHGSFKRRFPERDWILTRILWLCGCEPGYNRFGSVDSMGRFIYIHGTPDDTPLGQVGSRGCIRVSNSHIIALFDLLEARTPVEIVLN